MIDLEYLNYLNESVESFIGNIDSMFLDRFCATYKTIYFWIPVAIILFFIIIRNNIRKSYLLFFMMVLAAACCYAESYMAEPFSWVVSVIFGVLVFLSLQIKTISFCLPFLLSALIYSFSEVYDGLTFTAGIISIFAGTVTGTVFYWTYKLLTKNTTQQRSNNYSGYSHRVYTLSGYLSNDISLLQCMLYGTFIVILILTVTTSVSFK